MLEQIVAAAVGGLIVLIVAGMWAARGQGSRWFMAQDAIFTMDKKSREVAALDVLREQVVEVARDQGKELPVHAFGRNPTVVTFADGKKSYFFDDLERYRRAMQSGTASLTRSFWHAPPVPVADWSRESLEAWLRDNH